MTILILGGQGNLGTQLVKTFSTDDSVVSWDRSDLDVLDFEQLAINIKELTPELIINAVAFNAVDACEDPKVYPLAQQLNSKLPAFLADLALQQGITLIHYSSDYVFNGTKLKTSFSEKEVANPINKYGETKAQGEREISVRATRGLKYYLIRTSKLFGPPGSSPQAKVSFFELMLGLAQKQSELAIVDEELSCFTYTVDLAQATKKLWKSKMPSGKYHLVNTGPVTWYAAAQELFRLKKMIVQLRPLRSEDLLRAARRPKFSILQNTKTKKLRPWQEALQEYLNN